jgi:hypothetical protein
MYAIERGSKLEAALERLSLAGGSNVRVLLGLLALCVLVDAVFVAIAVQSWTVIEPALPWVVVCAVIAIAVRSARAELRRLRCARLV